MKPRQLRLSPELEKALLAGLFHGAVDLESVNPGELSPQGVAIYRAAKDLLVSGSSTPLALPELLLLLTNAYGVNQDQARAWLEGIRAAVPAAGGAGETVRKLRERSALLSIANAASIQLREGTYDPDKLFDTVAQAAVASAKPTPLAEQIGDNYPTPLRVPLVSLPRFTERVGGGLVGLTVLSGEPAVGKSDLALQASVETQRTMPVLLYDLDNGIPTIVEKLRRMVGNDTTALRAATTALYLRESIRTLDADLVHVAPPALVVVDIFQALPTPAEFERQGLGHWIHRLGALRRRGYVVLVVSEVNRLAYGNVGMGAFKGSGEIEYVADLACQMVPTLDGAALHVVKNRHGRFRGECVTLTRNRGLLWREVG